jgi:propionyl-CoA carboxylase alpha chain
MAHVERAHVERAAVVVKPITRLLVANRGEIARRIFHTAREMGIATVAIFADGDAGAPFVVEADTAIALNGRTPGETYLDIAKVLDAAKRSGADAIHPGYGFLSENAGFAQAVIDAGLAWIGPSPDVIAQMGDKLAAKKVMQEAGVPTLPAVELGAKADAKAAAKTIGYPVLVKASAGGGGRGMRVVEKEADLADAIASARREAAGAFGDDTVFLEKWLDKSRHVEIQIIGDRHGNLVHCFERECSIQRRHQKIIEEAPSSALDSETREAMCAAALNAARKLGYSSAGTVEFLLKGRDFYFLEVNARLQVEHPVTEAIVDRDLVREQIRIAEGEPLSFEQIDLDICGHAIEARLCAEDPAAGFLPSPGPIIAWQPSPLTARFDSGVEAGSVVAPEFDAMIAKVIVHAPTRREAAAKLARVLETTRVQGLTTNRDFLVATLRTPEFLAGDTTTDFIERVAPTPPAHRRAHLIEAAIAAAIEAQARRRQSVRVLRSIASGWRSTVMPAEQVAFAVGEETIRLGYRLGRDGVFRFTAGDSEHAVTVADAGGGDVNLAIDGLRASWLAQPHGDLWLVHGPHGDVALRELPRFPVAGATASAGGLKAPMPGVVLSTAVKPGDAVTRGQVLMILEAMKMEHRIAAPRDGVVAELHVAAKDQVKNGQLLLTLAEEKAE